MPIQENGWQVHFHYSLLEGKEQIQGELEVEGHVEEW